MFRYNSAYMKSKEQLIEEYQQSFAANNSHLSELSYDQAREHLIDQLVNFVARNRWEINTIDQKMEELQRERIGYAQDLEINEKMLKIITG